MSVSGGTGDVMVAYSSGPVGGGSGSGPVTPSAPTSVPSAAIVTPNPAEAATQTPDLASNEDDPNQKLKKTLKEYVGHVTIIMPQ